ncbi:energy-coupling factor transporter transmembrane component T [Cohnella fermenti]|uniref:energy-coupling factor transporter transmembrane component T n=1 Tax=Cohnella fermenti TaxID=2565925 RepID=UPI001454C8C4|nr:energy-coupling factor transporter transmembrane component T [Cohnella fermenti]
MRRDAFASYHPVVGFAYFVAVIAFSMLWMHPVLQAISLFGAVVYSQLLRSAKALRFNLLYMLPLLLFAALLNPAFNHAGATILFYLRSGNPVTLESLLYGAAAAVMFVTVLIWFSCYNAVMTSDKFIYLFGRLLPGLSLIFSMVLRFVPRYRNQIGRISLAQRSIGRDATQGSLVRKAQNGMRIVSIMTTWALENAIETADSMKARGYGLPRRTSFSLYRFDRRDRLALGWLAFFAAIVLTGAALGHNAIRFFPSIRMEPATPLSFIVYASYCALCLMPVGIQLVEDFKWKFIASRT